MDATSSSLNAKQRRKLLRQQQYAQETIKQEQEEVQVKQEPSALVHVVKEEPNDQQQQLYTKERRRLARLAKQKTEVVTQGDGPTDVPPTETSTATSEATSSTDNSQLNAQERRLLKRQAKRKAEGVEEYKPPTKKQKKKKQPQGEDGDGDHKSIHLTLFVGQLPYRATEAMVRNHFEEAGEIKLRMLTDKKTKRFKGTAFIEVKDSKALGAALSRHHTLLQGRRINVEMTTSGGGNKSENRRNKIDLLRKKQSNVQVEKTKALIQKHIDGPEYKLKQEDVDDRMIDFLSWFDYETAKKALDEYNRCVSDRVNNRKAFFMGILKRFRQTDGVE